MSKISDVRKQRLINSCQTMAHKYEKLSRNHYLIITEDGSEFQIQYNQNDYLHLTGITTNLSPRDFF